MKKAVIIVLFFASLSAYGQHDSATQHIRDSMKQQLNKALDGLDSVKAGWGNLDYAVPESPAFKMLGVQPTDLMRPTSVRNIAVSVGNYLTSDSKGVIPKNLSVEISPMLLSPNLNLRQYNENRWWYRSRLSLGTLVNDSGGYNMAAGLNFVLRDFSDKRDTRNGFLNAVLKYHDLSKLSQDSALKLLANSGRFPGQSFFNLRVRYNQNDSVVRAAVDSITSPSQFTNAIKAYRESFDKSKWNAEIWQLGIGVKTSSPDSLFKNVSKHFNYGVWSTHSYPIKENGQILIGLTVLGSSDSVGKIQPPDVSIGSRIYYGSNELKGFAELQGKMANQFKDSYITLLLGAEIRLEKGYWADVGFSFRNGSGPMVFVPSFSLKYAIPDAEKNKRN